MHALPAPVNPILNGETPMVTVVAPQAGQRTVWQIDPSHTPVESGVPGAGEALRRAEITCDQPMIAEQQVGGDIVAEASMQSFPASDAPPWWSGIPRERPG